MKLKLVLLSVAVVALLSSCGSKPAETTSVDSTVTTETVVTETTTDVVDTTAVDSVAVQDATEAVEGAAAEGH